MSKVEVGQVRRWNESGRTFTLTEAFKSRSGVESWRYEYSDDINGWAYESGILAQSEAIGPCTIISRDAMHQLSRAMLCIVRGDKYTRAAHGERMALAFNEREIVQELRAQLIRDKLEALETKRRCAVAWDPELIGGGE